MKDGDRFVQLLNRRNALLWLWLLLNSAELTQRDYFDWLDFSQCNKN